MNVRLYLTSSLATLAALAIPAAYADSYTEKTVIEKAPEPVTEMQEIKTEEVPSTTVIKEQPATVIEQPVKQKVEVKKHGGHLIQAGPIKIF